MRFIMKSVLLIFSFYMAPIAAHSEPLVEAIGHVLSTHPQIKSQTYSRLAVDEQLRQAKSGYYPSLDVLAGAGLAEHREPTDESLEPWETSITLRQNLFNGFSTVEGVGQQESAVASAAYKVQTVSEQLALRGCSAYLEVLRREDLKKVAQKNVETHLRIMDEIKLRGDSGVGRKSDTEQVQARLSLAQTNLVIAETNLLDAQSNYVSLIGYMPENLTTPDSPDSSIPESLENAVAQATSANPNIKSAEADLEARKRQYKASKAPYYPSVDLELEQTWSDETSTGEEGSKTDELSGMVYVRFNIFNGWQDEGRVAQNRMLINQAQEIKNNTERQVVESMKLSWRSYQSNQNLIGLIERRIAASESTAKAYVQQFDIGRRTLLDVLNTETEAINAQASLVEAKFDLLLSKYRILNGMGGLVKSLGLEYPIESQTAM